jgi:hypothetical protein
MSLRVSKNERVVNITIDKIKTESAIILALGAISSLLPCSLSKRFFSPSD